MTRTADFSHRVSATLSLLFLLGASSYGQTVKGQVVQQHLDAAGNGYSFIKVWGTHWPATGPRSMS